MPTFDTPGQHTYTVPSGVQTIRFTANGSGGGGGSSADDDSTLGANDGGSGGVGGQAQGTLSVSPGDSYTLYVPSGGSGGAADGAGGAGGSNGQDSGGAGTGGANRDQAIYGGGGGGGGADAIVYDNGTVLIAGEGGGGGGGGGADNDTAYGGPGGGGARGGEAGVDYLGNVGNDGSGSGDGGDGGDGGTGEAGGAPGDPGNDGGASVAAALTNTTTTTGGGGAGGSGGSGFGVAGGSGGAGEVVIEEAPPAPSLTAVAVDAISIKVDIGDTDNEDSAELEYKLSSEPTWTTAATFAAGELPATETIIGLLNGRDYDVRITATNNVGSSSTAITEQTVLPAPTNLTETDSRDSEIDISWTANHTNGSTRVEFREDDSGGYQVFATLSYTETTDTISGLLNGQLYGIRVVAETEDAETVDQ